MLKILLRKDIWWFIVLTYFLSWIWWVAIFYFQKMDIAKCVIVGKQKIVVRSSSKRFILRSGNNTIGFGTIVKLH